MAKVSVNYRSIAAEHTLVSAISPSTSWENTERFGDRFIGRLAKTTGIPSGATYIIWDQGTVVANYVSVNRFLIPPGHNLPFGFIGLGSLTLEYSNSASGPWTSVTATEVIDDGPTGFKDAKLELVTKDSTNRYWRLGLDVTTSIIQIPEIWLSETVVFGQSETIDAEKDYNVKSPANFSIDRNIQVVRTMAGARTAVKRGKEVRKLTLEAEQIPSGAYTDWVNFLEGIDWGLYPFFIDDPLGDTWFAEADLQQRVVSSIPRFNLVVEIAEITT